MPSSEFPCKVFPAPNDHEVFDRAVCTNIAFNKDRRLKVEVSYVQAGPRTWCAAVSELTVGDGGQHSPVALTRAHPSLALALADVLPHLLCRLRQLANAPDEVLQVRFQALPKSMYRKARRFGHDAIFALISGIPREIANDILKLLNGE